MAKRKQPDDDCYTDGEDSDSSSASTWKPSKKTGIRPRRTKQELTVTLSDSNNQQTGKEDDQHPASRHLITSPGPICTALLDWYAGVHESRGMPWRKPFDNSLDPERRAQRAYEVWISEIMLQQTQVATVIPYYNSWMEKFPTIKDLAASDIETVNGLWKGLGYYSRAARLLNGAQKVVMELDGRLPDNAKDLEAKMPGIGRYSAGAICSIAYNQRVPVLDGNVHRLLSRFLSLHAPPKAKATLDILWSGATALVEDTDRPGDLNQALIELGSTVCKVRDPSCTSCPLRQWCKAYQRDEANAKTHSGSSYTNSADTPEIEDICTLCLPVPDGGVTAYPMKAGHKKVREELDVVNVIEWRSAATSDRQFLLVRRPEGGLLAGLHEFPTMSNVPQITSSSDLTKITQSLLSWMLRSPPQLQPSSNAKTKRQKSLTGSAADADDGNLLCVTRIESAGDVLHVFSHIKKTYRLQWVVTEGGSEPPKLNPRPGDRPCEARTDRVRKMKTRGGDGVIMADEDPDFSPTLMWVPIDKVADANIGNGVLKVWNQVKSLWEQ